MVADCSYPRGARLEQQMVRPRPCGAGDGAAAEAPSRAAAGASQGEGSGRSPPQATRRPSHCGRGPGEERGGVRMSCGAASSRTAVGTPQILTREPRRRSVAEGGGDEPEGGSGKEGG